MGRFFGLFRKHVRPLGVGVESCFWVAHGAVAMCSADDDPPDHHRGWFSRKAPPWPVTVIGGALCFALIAVISWDKIENNAPRIRDAALRVLGKPEAASAPAQAPSPEQPKKVDAAKPSLPCVDDASDITKMLRALGGEKYEPKFNIHFKGRDTCFTLTLTEVGALRMAFETRTLFDLAPTFVVQPKNPADLKKFKAGTRLKIVGELTRHYDEADHNTPDASEVTESDMATDSIGR